MRCTIDLDKNDLSEMHKCLFDGFRLIGSFPEVRRGNSKGYHLIWHDTTKELMWFFRYLYDDPNRVRLDLCSDKRVKQVLFRKKTVFYPNKTFLGESKRITR